MALAERKKKERNWMNYMHAVKKKKCCICKIFVFSVLISLKIQELLNGLQ